jgi:endonuclease YncB( thermonuclease family)
VLAITAFSLLTRSHVVDGDTVIVSGVTVKLKGVDAPERFPLHGPAAANGLRSVAGSRLS